MSTKRKLTEQELEIFEYLNDLRLSGETNMFGSPAYVITKFRIPRDEAVSLVSLWMSNFHEDIEAYKELLIKE